MVISGGKGWDPEAKIDVDLSIPSILPKVPSISDIGVDIIKGIENGYGYIRTRMVGKEDEIVAAFTIGTLSVLAGIYIYQRAKKGEL